MPRRERTRLDSPSQKSDHLLCVEAHPRIVTISRRQTSVTSFRCGSWAFATSDVCDSGRGGLSRGSSQDPRKRSQHRVAQGVPSRVRTRLFVSAIETERSPLFGRKRLTFSGSCKHVSVGAGYCTGSTAEVAGRRAAPCCFGRAPSGFRSNPGPARTAPMPARRTRKSPTP